MSGTSGPSSPDGARNQANSDVAANRGPALTHNWNSSAREAYETEYARQRDQQNSNKSY